VTCPKIRQAAEALLAVALLDYGLHLCPHQHFRETPPCHRFVMCGRMISGLMVYEPYRLLLTWWWIGQRIRYLRVKYEAEQARGCSEAALFARL